jgi:dihydrofolate reductase
MLAPYLSTLKDNEMGIAAKLNSMPKYVVSGQLQNASWNNSMILRDDVVNAVRFLKEKSGSEIQIEGSATMVQSLTNSGLIDEYRFLVHPVVMGTGKRFFKEGVRSPGLQLVLSRPMDKGVMLLCYQPI